MLATAAATAGCRLFKSCIEKKKNSRVEYDEEHHQTEQIQLTRIPRARNAITATVDRFIARI